MSDAPGSIAGAPSADLRYGRADLGAPLAARLAALGSRAAVIERMLAHRSVRAFLDSPLPAGTLELLVAAAQSAATSSNLQAFSIVAVEDAARRQRLSVLANHQAHVARAPLFLVWVADLSRADRTAARLGECSDANRFFEMFLVATVDTALAAQNATLAAESLGLGAVYIGALRNHPERVAEELRLPPRAFALFGMCIGVPDPTRPADVKPRLAQSLVLHREQYDPATEPDGIAAYDDVMRAFQRSQRMTEQPWSRQASQRVRDAASLSGRHGLLETVRRMGFELD